MRSDRAGLTQGALLLTSFVLTACGGGAATQKSMTQKAAPAPAPVITSIGTDFYLTLPDHLCTSAPAKCNNAPVNNRLIVAGATATTGNVTFNGVTTPFSVTAGGEAVLALDPAVVLTANEMVEAKAIHVTALSPVSVHVVSENPTSADGYLALPTPGLGTKYYVMSYASIRYTGSEFAVAATQNSTTVSITPTAAGATKPVGTTFTVLLNAGETYQFANPANADMTGTLVAADKPVAVVSGHRCTDIPSGVGYCDYIVEQLPDVSVWGKTFHTSPFSGRARYTVRVMASVNGTTLTTIPAGLIPGTLNAGQFVDVDLTGAGEFVSNNPVLMAQFMRGYADDLAGKGDPSMVLVTPAEMGMTDATFGVHGLAGTSGTFMNVVTETAALATLKLDNVVVNTALFTPIGGASIYSVGTIPVAAGAHSLLGTVPYSALVYDYGIPLNAVSYAYPVATKLSIPAPVATTTTSSTVCAEKQETEGLHSSSGHDIHTNSVNDDLDCD
ncbi:MAG: IgGFc-binding protein [Nitrosomonadales bacterium]|nr:IgGFc-binding protein [Nitrosomonadales bacterium]